MTLIVLPYMMRWTIDIELGELTGWVCRVSRLDDVFLVLSRAPGGFGAITRFLKRRLSTVNLIVLGIAVC